MTSSPESFCPVVTDLMVCSLSSLPPFTCELNPHQWYPLQKDLYQYQSQHQTAWLYLAVVDEKKLADGDLMVVDIRVGGRPGHLWEDRSGGIWILRSLFSGSIQHAVTEVDVLFGTDAVDPRPQWTLIHARLQLEFLNEMPARLTIHHGRARPRADPATMRFTEDGKFRIVQISDTHMVTGTGVCTDSIDVNGTVLPARDADPLTVDFIGKILDIEKPDLVVLTGDQLHHGITDSQSALLKLLAPIIGRSIPFVIVFGNHDCEGKYALSRMAQMTMLQSLPFSLCEPGPAEVDGVGNFSLQVLAPSPSQLPLSTLYFLDSHGEIESKTQHPDYEPIKQSQIDWFTTTSQAERSLREKVVSNNDLYLSIVFQHIPLPEFRSPQLQIRNGYRREPTESPSYNSHFYDTLVQEGISALSCGHDHVNDFCALLSPQSQQHEEVSLIHSPWLCYGGCSGFGGYCSYDGKAFHRGMRVWELGTRGGSLTTWKRVEYVTERVDEIALF